MGIYFTIMFFVFGTIMGSFYNVVASRLPKGESIVFPSSHCDNCKHILGPLELIPIFSFLLLGGKCRNCGQKISWVHPFFEFVTGLLFAFSYLAYGLSLDLIVILTFVSILDIIIMSDYYYMIISDEVLIAGVIFLILEYYFIYGLNPLGKAIFNGLVALLIMFLLKKFGDFLFKRESMGGGDIKLMFIFGFVLGYPMAVVSIFLASLVGLPISLLLMRFKKTNLIPFGPFLSIGALIITFLKLNFNTLIDLLTR